MKRGILSRSSFPAILSVFLLLTVASGVFAQDEPGDREEMSKKAANPIANVVSVPFQNNTDFGLGTFDRSSNILTFQPVMQNKYRY